MKLKNLFVATLIGAVLLVSYSAQAQDRSAAPSPSRPQASGPATLAIPKMGPPKFECGSHVCGCTGGINGADCKDLAATGLCAKDGLGCGGGDDCTCCRVGKC
jgi:hypothetical protein